MRLVRELKIFARGTSDIIAELLQWIFSTVKFPLYETSHITNHTRVHG